MTISAAFTVDGDANPAAHSVAYDATITLARTSLQGTAAWSMVGGSNSTMTLPTLTPSTTGATATFAMVSDPSDDLGRSVLVKCSVTDGRTTVVEYGVIGVPNSSGIVPVACGEENYRDATYGWTDELNAALNGGSGLPLTAVLYVDKNSAASTETGTIFAPFKTIVAALAIGTQATTFLIANGNYVSEGQISVPYGCNLVALGRQIPSASSADVQIGDVLLQTFSEGTYNYCLEGVTVANVTVADPSGTGVLWLHDSVSTSVDVGDLSVQADGGAHQAIISTGGIRLFKTDPNVTCAVAPGTAGYLVVTESSISCDVSTFPAGTYAPAVIIDEATRKMSFGSGILRPSTITGTANDYDPGGADPFFWFAAYCAFLSSDADGRQITGFPAIPWTSAFPMSRDIIINGSHTITFKHMNAGSLAANRIYCNGAADITVSPNDVLRLIYDTTAGNWRLFKAN